MNDTGGTPRTRTLAAALRREMDGSAFGVREVARVLGLSHSTVSQWVNGRRVPNPDSVSALLAVIRVTGLERANIMELAHNAADPHWLSVGPDVSHPVAGIIECEKTASEIIEWTPWLVTGLLQMPAYIHAVMSGDPDRSKDEVDRRVRFRLERQKNLRKPQPPKILAFIGEPGIRQIIGGRTAMIDQLDHLITVSRLGKAHVRVVPIGEGWHPGLTGPFVLYRFDRSPSVLHFEHHGSTAFLSGEEQTARFAPVVRWLDRVALSEHDTAVLITKVIEELEVGHERAPLAKEQPQ
jgi:transcriptional regulator with XRE-family HTH domain